MNFKRPEKLIWEKEPPWNWEQIWFSVFASQEKTNDIINQLPGSKINNDIAVLNFSLEIFFDSIEDLFSSINIFKKNSEEPNFWYRSNEDSLEKLEKKINRAVFSSTLAAMSLVDNSRIFSKNYSIEGYPKKVDESFKNNSQHVFIQSLRNYFAHVKITRANWNINWSKKGRNVSFNLYRKELLEWNNWNVLAKEYINACPDGVNIEDLFNEYSDTVKNFHDWFRQEIFSKYNHEISEYRKYSKKIKGVHAYCQWNLLIQQGYIPKRIDPYDYLDLHLTKVELDEILVMPKRSKKQVDRIIEILDEYEVCDANLRKHIYTLFKLNQTQSRDDESV